MEADVVPKIMEIYSKLIWLITAEDFTAYSHYEHKSYIYQNSCYTANNVMSIHSKTVIKGILIYFGKNYLDW
jgi:hypothetical protein